MNERLKELAYQSGLLSKRVFDDSFVSNPKLEAKLQKFSELIVKSCVNAIPLDMDDAEYRKAMRGVKNALGNL